MNCYTLTESAFEAANRLAAIRKLLIKIFIDSLFVPITYQHISKNKFEAKSDQTAKNGDKR